MGQHQIIEKLRLEFDGEITSERQVVYILVEIGKLLEHDNAKATYPTITFYRDWVRPYEVGSLSCRRQLGSSVGSTPTTNPTAKPKGTDRTVRAVAAIS